MTGFVLGPKRQLQRHDEIGGMARRRQLPGTEASKQVKQVKHVHVTHPSKKGRKFSEKNVRRKVRLHKNTSTHPPHIHHTSHQRSSFRLAFEYFGVLQLAFNGFRHNMMFHAQFKGIGGTPTYFTDGDFFLFHLLTLRACHSYMQPSVADFSGTRVMVALVFRKLKQTFSPPWTQRTTCPTRWALLFNDGQ